MNPPYYVCIMHTFFKANYFFSQVAAAEAYRKAGWEAYLKRVQ